ncbi:MAG: hypothetical protein ACK58L_15115 [Planctomycetota bacterium]
MAIRSAANHDLQRPFPDIPSVAVSAKNTPLATLPIVLPGLPVVRTLKVLTATTG